MAVDTVDNQAALDLLSNISAKGDNVNVNDIQNYTPQGFTPQQQQDFNAQYQPTMGAMPNSTYYPDLGHNINVGNYSGSEIGSTTLFAPGGGLVPIGLMDERDAAIHRAALKKAKDVEDFNKQFQSPTTKHTAVQKDLTNNYYEGLQKWQSTALKKAGGNQAMANQMLKQDPSFNQWNKGMQDRAKMQDQGIEIAAQLTALEKDPNMVLSPEVREAKKKFMSGEYAAGDYFGKEGTNFTKNLIAMQGLADLDVKTNKAIDKFLPEVEQLTPDKMKALGIDPYTTRGKNELAKFVETETFSPERIKDLAHSVYMSEYQGTGMSEADVLKSIQSKVADKVKLHVQHYDKWFKPDADAGKAEDYSNAQPISNTSYNFNSNGKTGEVHVENVTKTSATDEAKKISIPLSSNTVDVNGQKLNEKTGNVTGSVGQVMNVFYDRNTKKPLTPEEVKKYKEHGNHNIKMETKVMFNLEPTKGQEKGNTIILDANEVLGKFPKKGKEKKSFDDTVKEYQQLADDHNKKPLVKTGTPQEKPATAAPTKKKIAGF